LKQLDPSLFLHPDLLKDTDEEIRSAIAKTFVNARSESGYNALIDLLRDEKPRVRFFAAMSLGKLKGRIVPILQMLQKNADQDGYLVHAGVCALVNSGDFGDVKFAATNENVSIR